MNAAYSLYDLFRTLVERVGWPTEGEKKAALDSINQAESMGILGNLATLMACPHDKGTYGDYGQTRRCKLCDRII